MAIDPTIALNAKPVQMPNPLQMLGDMARTQYMLTNGNALQQQMNSNIAMSHALSGAIRPDGTIDTGKAMLGLQNSPYAYNALPMAKELQGIQQGQIGIDTGQQALAQKRLGSLQTALGSLVNDPNLSPEKVLGTGAQLVRDGVIDQNTFTTHLGNIANLNPDQLRDYLRQQYYSVLSPDQLRAMQTPQYYKMDNGANVSQKQINPFAVAAPDYKYPKQLTPAEAASPITIPSTGPNTPPRMETTAQFVGQSNGTPGGIVAGQSPSNQAYNTSVATSAADNEKDLLNRVWGGAQLMHNLQEQQQLLTQARAGGGANWRAAAAQKLQGIPGVSQSLVDAVAGGNLGSAQTLQKLMVQGAVAQMKSMMSGHQTEGQMNAFLNANPNLDKDPRALDKITQFYNSIYQNDVAQQHSLLNWKQQHQGRDSSSFFQQYSVSPTQQAFSAVKPSGGSPTVVKTGTYNGKKVVQYSDGSVRYAQ